VEANEIVKYLIRCRELDRVYVCVYEDHFAEVLIMFFAPLILILSMLIDPSSLEGLSCMRRALKMIN